MPSRYRAQLVNSLAGFKSANLIGSADAKGQTNLAIISSVVHLGSEPALMGFISRPASVERHTLTNILRSSEFTINQVNRNIWQAAHQTSARYHQSISEFHEVGLTPEFSGDFTAPFVKESYLKMGLKLKEVVDIKANNTQLIVGEITEINCNALAIKPDGYIDVEALESVALSGLDSYHGTSRLARLSYAKPEQPLSKLSIEGVPY